MATRINKYLSEVGYCSRRRADKLIEAGKVTINGKVTEIGTKVQDNDKVEVEIAENVTVEVIRGTGIQSLMNSQDTKK